MATSGTLMPALRLGGSPTLRVLMRGLQSQHVGDTLAMSFFIPFGPRAGAETVEMVLARGGMGGNGNGGGAGGAPSWMSA